MMTLWKFEVIWCEGACRSGLVYIDQTISVIWYKMKRDNWSTGYVNFVDHDLLYLITMIKLVTLKA